VVEHLAVTRCEHGVATVTINRVDRRNALSLETCQQAIAAVDALPADGAVVITGAGSVFSSGADLKDSAANRGRLGSEFLLLFDRLASRSSIVVAAINGPAVGLGALLALAADLRIASCSGVLEVPALRLGLSLREVLVRRAAERLGDSLTRMLLLGTLSLSADRAQQCGLVTDVVDPVLPAAQHVAHQVATFAPENVGAIKRSMLGQGNNAALPLIV
jgi:enoyl-CoA hydratase